jgi:hypothetical protein
MLGDLVVGDLVAVGQHVADQRVQVDLLGDAVLDQLDCHPAYELVPVSIADLPIGADHRDGAAVGEPVGGPTGGPQLVEDRADLVVILDQFRDQVVAVVVSHCDRSLLAVERDADQYPHPTWSCRVLAGHRGDYDDTYRTGL